MTFEEVLANLKNGFKARRRGWNGPDQWIHVHRPIAGEAMTQPYCYIRNQHGYLVPWGPSQDDLFAEDWELVY